MSKSALVRAALERELGFSRKKNPSCYDLARGLGRFPQGTAERHRDEFKRPGGLRRMSELKWVGALCGPSFAPGCGCASRPTCRNSHRPAAAFFFNSSPRGRVLGAPGGGRAPRDHRRCRAHRALGATPSFQSGGLTSVSAQASGAKRRLRDGWQIPPPFERN